MGVEHELSPIDDFEARFGNHEAVKRTCDFMVAYLDSADRPLPEIAAKGMTAASRYKNGVAVVQALEAQRQVLSAYLRERFATTDCETPDHCIVQAVLAILISYQKPEWGGGASELASNFLHATGKFGIGTDRLVPLLAEYFSN